MSYREKSAWISVVLYLAIYGYYAWRLYEAAVSGNPAYLPSGQTFVGMVVVLVILQTILHVAAAAAKPKDAMAPKDEREKLIELRATFVAFYVLSIGALAVAAALGLGMPPAYAAHALILALVVGETVRNAGQIVYFRLGA